MFPKAPVHFFLIRFHPISHISLVLLLGIAIFPSAVMAQSPAPSWETSFLQTRPASYSLIPTTSRMLVDGSYMVVGPDNQGFSAVRYDASGNVLTQATFSPYGYPLLVSLDPFGQIFLVNNGLYIWKFDGLTGLPSWPTPVSLTDPTYQAAAPIGATLDPSGSLYIVAYSTPPPYYCPSYFVAKLDAVSGIVYWVQSLLDDLQCNTWPSVSRIVADPVGHLFIGGLAGQWTLYSLDILDGTINWGPAVLPPLGTLMMGFGDMTLDHAGNLLVTGLASSGSTWSDVLVKLSGSSGALAWGPVPGSLGPLAIDARDDLVVGGSELNGASGNMNWLIVKYRGTDGVALWGPVVFNLSPTSSDIPKAITINGINNVTIAGISHSSTIVSTALLQLSGATGDILWGPQTLPALNSDPYLSPLLVNDPSGNAIVSTASGSGSSQSWLTASFAEGTGQTLYGPVSFAGQGPDFTDVVSLKSDSVGDVFSLVADGPSGTFGSDLDSLALTKRDGTSGAILWGPNLAVGSSYKEYWSKIVFDSTYNPIVAATAISPSQTPQWLVAKFDNSTGSLLWGPVTLPGSNYRDSLFSASVDASGDVYVGGKLNGLSTVAKLAGTDGTLIWQTTYSEGLGSWPVVDMAIGADQNVVLGLEGLSFAKLDSTSGAVLWGPVSLGVPWDIGRPHIVLDSAGNVLVAGNDDGQIDGLEFWIVLKLSGGDGSTMWGPTVESVAGSAEELLTDSSGDLIVGGTLLDGLGDESWGLARYSGVDGSRLWGPINLGGLSVNSNDNLNDMFFDSTGNIVAVGFFSELSGKNDGGLASLDSQTGNRIWGPTLFQKTTDSGFNRACLSAGGFALGGHVECVGLLAGYSANLGIVAPLDDLPPAVCFASYEQSFVATGGVPPYSWSVSAGTLPTDLSLSSSTGVLSGTPLGSEVSSFTIRLTDSGGGFVERSYNLSLLESNAPPYFQYETTLACPGTPITLQVWETFQSYYWIPTGETTSSITISPTNPTVYGVIVTEADGCTHHGSFFVDVGIGDPPSIHAPRSVPVGAAGVLCYANSPENQYTWALTGGTIFDGQGTSNISIDAGPPGTTMDLAVYATATAGCSTETADVKIQVDFLDVPPTNPFHDFVDTIARNGVTAGCGAGDFCPGNSVLRSQMAVFLLRGEHGSVYVPPPATGIFGDVPASNPFAPWIEQLYAEGITGGCSTNPLLYCPSNSVSRAGMAVFLLVAQHGSGYAPPACNGIFTDVACPGPFTNWIEQLYNEGITGGCNTNPLMYCPTNSVTRAQMAVFLTVTFGLP